MELGRKKWKEISEQMAVLDLEEVVVDKTNEDKELIKFFIQCFDRSAFQDRICQEGRMEDFDKAIEDTICDMLVALRKRLRIAKDAGAYSAYGEGEVMYCFYDRELEMWFDSTREEILKILSAICEEIGVHGLHFHRKQYRW